MRFHDLILGEEWLPRLAFSPVVTIEQGLRVMRKVVVGLATLNRPASPLTSRSRGVGDEPACLLQKRRQGNIGRRKRLRLLDIVWIQPSRCLVTPQDEGRPRTAANRGGGVAAAKTATLADQSIEVWRRHPGHP